MSNNSADELDRDLKDLIHNYHCSGKVTIKYVHMEFHDGNEPRLWMWPFLDAEEARTP